MADLSPKEDIFVKTYQEYLKQGSIRATALFLNIPKSTAEYRIKQGKVIADREGNERFFKAKYPHIEEPIFDSLFDTLHYRLLKKGYSDYYKISHKWFNDQVKSLMGNDRKKLLNDNKLVARNKAEVGKLYLYFYDAKYKEELPYWDKFPLALVIDVTREYHLTLNLHYLPIKERIILMDQLLKRLSDKRMNETTRLKISYDYLQSVIKNKLFIPCIKKHLISHIRSEKVLIPVSEWDIALMLPVEQFIGSNKTTVWRDSKQKIRKAMVK